MQVSLTTFSQEEIVITVTNVLGQTVGILPLHGMAKNGLFEEKLDISSLAAGMYVVQVQQHSEQRVLKFVK
ncbi:T9SS type A sorting domain-containing protein [Siccationidurans soli]|uniref:T9SS type A sorting domain-containing protein n=1 Tax=Hymenobacter negativus TaxID=2795026 RepID=A0ABS3QC16_9BACT|nr:T9SS type A sorting domain-containing protein [Hymenobacter negativus]